MYTTTKEGRRDIQFLEYLEWKYDCNFLQSVSNETEHCCGYAATTQKEIFHILDKCHVLPTYKDAMFDFGCGKGAALVSFLDYGFSKVGGVEYDAQICDVLEDNITRLGLRHDYEISVYHQNAVTIDTELDAYNWFYFFQPFDRVVLQKCIEALQCSLERNLRKIHIIYRNPYDTDLFISTRMLYVVNQFTCPCR